MTKSRSSPNERGFAATNMMMSSCHFSRAFNLLEASGLCLAVSGPVPRIATRPLSTARHRLSEFQASKFQSKDQMVQWIEARRSLSFRAALSAHALLGRASDDLLHDAADLRKRSAGRDARAASDTSRRPVPATPRARSPPELPGSRPRALPLVTAVGDY